MRDHFFKYTDIDTADAILSNRSFRYSSPLKFNDPFDIQNELLADFDLSEFPAATMAVIEEYVKNDFPIPNPNEGFGKGIMMLRNGAKIHGYKKEEIERITIPLLGHLMSEINNTIEELNKTWKISMRESRVFCVTEDNDNLLMWAHYAKDHTGVVFELATLVEQDTVLSAAKKVTYEEKPIAFFSLKELVEWTLFDVDPDFSKTLYSNHAYQKSTHWDYENEWRVVDMCQYDNKTDLYVDHGFPPNQLTKVIFGCKTDPKKIELLSAKARAINPSVGIYQASKKPLEYALEIKNITS